MTALSQHPTAQTEATEIVVEVAQEYGRDGCALTLLIDGVAPDEWETLPGKVGPSWAKREHVGPHTIEYRKGDR